MKGQWIGRYTGDQSGSVILNVDDEKDHFSCVAFTTPDDTALPGSAAFFNVPHTQAPRFSVTAYMNLLRDTAILDLQRRNVEVLQEQLRQTRDRFNVGEVTRTDVAQSESRLAAGRSQVLSAEATYKASVATYRQVIGVEPGKLAPGSPVDRFSPNTLTAMSPRVPAISSLKRI